MEECTIVLYIAHNGTIFSTILFVSVLKKSMYRTCAQLLLVFFISSSIFYAFFH